ncbi:MAG: hypothetical protein AAF715_16360 [Myxococcota bacterium]
MLTTAMIVVGCGGANPPPATSAPNLDRKPPPPEPSADGSRVGATLVNVGAVRIPEALVVDGALNEWDDGPPARLAIDERRLALAVKLSRRRGGDGRHHH